MADKWEAHYDDERECWLVRDEWEGTIVFVHSNADVFTDDTAQHEAAREECDEKAEAYALRIAASPELLAACESAMEMIGDPLSPEVSTFNLLRAAIAKATKGE